MPSIVSPSLRLESRLNVCGAIEHEIDRTEPSHSEALKLPGCDEPNAACKGASRRRPNEIQPRQPNRIEAMAALPGGMPPPALVAFQSLRRDKAPTQDSTATLLSGYDEAGPRTCGQRCMVSCRSRGILPRMFGQIANSDIFSVKICPQAAFV